jgi:predicted nicotinamide N-methyase
MIDEINDQDFQEDERLPYWAELWPSAIALSEYVLENRHYFRNKRLLELGSGLGLCGIAATKAGADVLFTDYDEDALKMTEANFIRNFNRAPAVELFDWREPLMKHRFDVIIASDILYERRWLDPVRQVLSKFIVPDGFAFIAEPGRTVALPFFKTMLTDGWKDQKYERPVSLDRKNSKITIHRLHKC